jgi:hypothetical protein
MNQLPRSRLPILCGAAFVCWTAAWYSLGGSMALLSATVVCAVLAIILPRPLPPTTRSAIWSAMLALIVLLAANLERIAPPEETADLLRVYQYDRIVTLFLALALTALFFRPSNTTVTIVSAGCLPMLMLTLVRDHDPMGRDYRGLMIWGGLALSMLAAQTQRIAQPRSDRVVRAGQGEWGLRIALPLLTLWLAFLMAIPIAAGAHRGREWLFGIANWTPPDRSRTRSNVLSLKAPPAGFAGRVRPLIDIRAPQAPGYLRESVFLLYAGGQWLRRSGGAQSESLAETSSVADDDGYAYAIGPQDENPLERWTVSILAPSRVAGLCLPGQTRVLNWPIADAPVADRDGIVTFENGSPPPRFTIDVLSAAADAAYPWPETPDNGDYLVVPSALRSSVSNWVANCDGLLEAQTTETAIAVIELFFRNNFDYSLDAVTDGIEPLETFMTAREGHCTLFASVATLMLRERGIPARMVSGYFCSERHALTGRWVARERNGHAWAEAWDEAAGHWRLVEPTPPSGLPDDFPSPGRFRLAFEGLAAAWRGLIHWIRNLNPLVAVAEAGLWLYLFLRRILTHPAAWLVMAGLAVGWRVRRRLRRRGRQLDETERLRRDLIRGMTRLERQKVPARLRRRMDEPWTVWQARVADDLPAETAAKLNGLLDRYQNLRYRPAIDPLQAQVWIDDVRKQ